MAKLFGFREGSPFRRHMVVEAHLFGNLLINRHKHESMKLYIKYMVSLRCKMQVEDILRKLHIKYTAIDLGMAELPHGISQEDRLQLGRNLLKTGLELLDDQRSILIERIKTVIIEMIHYAEEIPKTNYSGYISEKLNYDYTYLANTFSEVTGVTIQQYIINHKIEKVKELLLYEELRLGEIAFRLHYSSPAHLSSQFKKMTGVSPSFYKKLGIKRKQNLEDL